MADNKICIGHVVGTHGLKGDLKIKVFIEALENLQDFSPITDMEDNLVVIKNFTVRKKGLIIAQIDDCNSIDQAQKLVGNKLYGSLDGLSKLDEDEDTFYRHELIGLGVIMECGQEFGIISDINDFGAGNIVEVTTQNKKQQLFIFNRETFKEINKEAGYAIICPPDAVVCES